ncbi:unnamed protein product [Coffea canephora]|uniref:DH200=94 genomic scaffold, scaffold_816 n=1 Tax=Coffea canephora TaxID=49390 RepID=A0A068VA72_COFCA|nr:unnamed protein product [Coffea canephora]CDP17449.1 unnamed protein product [Coffea canephora]CDP19986.1 unnamed protein product [Coffea canephora]
MDRRTFGILCEMIRDTGGLKATRNMSIEEIVAMFVYVLAHHKKSRTICGLFWRSRETVSQLFRCLRWTLIDVTPPTEQKSRYRMRKGSVATNVLGICCYYLVDAGYCNADGFLAPYRGQRYHLNEFNVMKKMENDEIVRGRGKNKCFWTGEEVKVLIESLQELACDPMFHAIVEMCKESGCSWNDAEKKISYEKQWYDDWCKTHKDAKGLWDVKFPYLGDLEIVYGRDRATGNVAEDFTQTVQDMEAVQNLEEGDEGLDAMSNSDNDKVEEDEVNSMEQSTQPSSTSTRNSKKQKKQSPPIANVSKKMKSASTTRGDLDASLQLLTSKFGDFVEGIQANFTTIAAAMSNEDKREQLVSDRRDQVVAELMKLALPSGDVMNAADILSEQISKLHVFYNLPAEMKRQYVINLLYPPSTR